jgi:NAD(P)-dependent dehydrogenase (short-subunit alcohol dehydrogenase family)
MPLERLPTPQDVASAVVWLARATAVTGQTIFVDAGANLEAYPRDFVYLGRE